MKPFKKDISDISIEKAHGGSGSRKLLLSKLDGISKNIEAVTKGYLEVGKSFDWHFHDCIDEFFIVLEGTGVIKFEDGIEIEYKSEDLIYIPANLSHKIEALGDKNNEFFFFRILK